MRLLAHRNNTLRLDFILPTAWRGPPHEYPDHAGIEWREVRTFFGLCRRDERVRVGSGARYYTPPSHLACHAILQAHRSDPWGDWAVYKNGAAG